MWLLLLPLALIFNTGEIGSQAWAAPISSVQKVDTSIGPTSSSEAKILWSNAQDFYGKGRYKDAVYPLKRLLDRYPGYPDAASYREARLQLGRSYLESGQAEEAVPQLRGYLEGSGERKNSDAGRLYLGDAYLRLKRFNEAYLLSLELENHSSSEIQIQALLLRARAQIGLGQDARALSASGSARKMSERLKKPAFVSEAIRLQLELKTRDCARHPGPGPLEESQVLAQLDYRGICLNEALVQLNDIISNAGSKPAAADEALALLKQGFADFSKACMNPPDPTPLRPKAGEISSRPPRDRTQAELRRYRSELTEKLKQACGEHRKTAKVVISGWKKDRRLKSLEESLK